MKPPTKPVMIFAVPVLLVLGRLITLRYYKPKASMKSHILSLFFISATPVFAQEEGGILPGENLTSFGAHPYQMLSMAGNLIGLSVRDPIPEIDFELIWDVSTELCGDFEAILAEDYSQLAMSTDSIDLGRGYHTLAWTPDLVEQESPLFLNLGEKINESVLFGAQWRAQIEGISFEYNAAMQSNHYRGWIGACVGTQEVCDPIIEAEFRPHDLAEILPDGLPEAVVKLLGPSFSYPENAPTTVWQDIPNIWFLQFMNIVQNNAGTFLVSFQSPNFNKKAAFFYETHGFMIWDITERQLNNYAVCWFSNPKLEIQTPQTQGN